ncbi:SEC-C domain-containing protein [Myxococcota bacterium]|nr:SEC-C domain-containing protein [Myxococcota bacterium]
MATVGRNDPCPCGSGKKYKKCHQEQDEARGRELRTLSGIDEWLRFHTRRLHEHLAPHAEGASPVLAAAETFFGEGERPGHPLDDGLFRDHALFDVPVGAEGETLAALHGLDDGLASVGDTRVMATALAASYLSFLEVTEVKRGKGFGMRDVLTDTEAFIWDETMAASVEPMEYLLARRLPFTDRPLLAPAWRKVAFHGRKSAAAAARAAFDEAGFAPDDVSGRLAWLKGAAPRLLAWARAFHREGPLV